MPWLPLASDVGGATPELLHIRDEKPSGTTGGGFTAGAWQIRTLNTVKTNEIAGASLASNVVTLPAGTYEADIAAPAIFVVLHKARLYDVTGAAVLIHGTSERSNNGAGVTTSASRMRGRFTLSVTSNVRVEHRCSVTNGTDGFGPQTGFGDIEVYTDFVIRKIA